MMDEMKKGVAEDGEILKRLVMKTILLERTGGELGERDDDGGEAVYREDERGVQKTSEDELARGPAGLRCAGQLAG
jgi:hypothetical protein